ncbi:MAG: hypothetical protein MJA29_10805 [Candidatus Omnitrophica bacterium]|nr:hypothetical protein [Candidatus Omnitrophota bacterium]
MRRKYGFLALVFLSLLVIGYRFPERNEQESTGNNCDLLRREIIGELDNANYCHRAEDCTSIALSGPRQDIECYSFVNRRERTGELYGKIERYFSRCSGELITECSMYPVAVCNEQGRCVSKGRDSRLEIIYGE